MTDYCEAMDLEELAALARKDGYNLDEHGVIRTPGKFEGEPVDVLYWHDCALNGNGDEEYALGYDGSAAVYFDLHSESIPFYRAHPKDLCVSRFARLEYVGRGFVELTYLTAEEADAQREIDAGSDDA